MNNSVEKLHDDKILSTDDVREIKTHLESNYKHCSSADRAKLFSKRVTTIVDNGLKEVNQAHRPKIKNSLIKDFATNTENQITNKHLFDEITEIEERVWKEWVQEKYGDNLNLKDLESYVKMKNYKSKLDYIKALLKKHYTDVFTWSKCKSAFSRIYRQTQNIQVKLSPKLILSFILLFIVSFTTVYSILNYMDQVTHHAIGFVQFTEMMTLESDLDNNLLSETSLQEITDTRGYPDLFRYKPINTLALKQFLESKNSKLLEDTYVSEVIAIAIEYDVNPILLFSIMGQEQGFIPTDHEFADQIINNPYNVYGSWQDFNTTFEESTQIAAVTVNNILDKRPKGEEPFTWLNDTYAEDPDWHKGVKFFFYKISELTAI